MTFRVRWPNGAEESLDSPSSAVDFFFKPGDRLLMTEFVARLRGALSAGFPAHQATSVLARIEHTASQFAQDREAAVLVVSLDSAI